MLDQKEAKGLRRMALLIRNLPSLRTKQPFGEIPLFLVLTSSLTLLASVIFSFESSNDVVATEWKARLFERFVIVTPFLALFVGFLRWKRSLGHLMDTSPENWEYIAEGALNIAVRYQGKLRSLQGRVLRLRKKSRLSRIKSSLSQSSDTDFLDEEEQLATDDLEEALATANTFVNNVMLKLLSPRFVSTSQVVKLGPKFIEDLAKRIEPYRPEKRRQITVLNQNAGCGLLTKDSAQIPCGCSENCTSYCFEIKPKWGFLSTESKDWDVKRRVDRFTMHQHLKKTMDHTVEISDYCPLDLFHGGRDGISKCIKALETCPQNNLRLFVNGKMAFPMKTKTSMLSILGGNGNHDDLVEALTETLLKEAVLDRVLKAQTVGPLNDIESVYPIYVQLVKEGLGEIDIHEGFDETYHPKVPPESEKDRIEIVKRFLISCTARDCSIMITLSSCPTPAREPLGRCCSLRWNYDVNIVDLDAKPIGKMSYYYKVDRDIARTYMEKVEGVITHLKSSSSLMDSFIRDSSNDEQRS